ncbi:MAG: TlpA family protein disulfide reductase [Myxococcales bacterium]
MNDQAAARRWHPFLGRLQRAARPIAYALLAFVFFQWFARNQSGPKTGEPAAEFSLKLASDEQEHVTLADLRGSPAVIEVVASWCSACRSMAPTMAEVAKVPRKRAVHFLAVAVDTPSQEAVAMHTGWGIPFSIAMADSKFTSDFRINTLPTIIVLDAEGRVRQVTSGTTRARTIDRWLSELGADRM